MGGQPSWGVSLERQLGPFNSYLDLGTHVTPFVATVASSV